MRISDWSSDVCSSDLRTCMQFRAAVMHAANAPLTIETVETAPLEPNDVLVRIGAARICHTDLEVLSGEIRYPMPMVLGHEASRSEGRRGGNEGVSNGGFWWSRYH